MQAQSLRSSQAERLEALRRRHATIDKKVRDALRHPSVSDYELHSLKAQKLMLKDEMEQLKAVS